MLNILFYALRNLVCFHIQIVIQVGIRTVRIALHLSASTHTSLEMPEVLLVHVIIMIEIAGNRHRTTSVVYYHTCGCVRTVLASITHPVVIFIFLIVVWTTNTMSSAGDAIGQIGA